MTDQFNAGGVSTLDNVIFEQQSQISQILARMIRLEESIDALIRHDEASDTKLLSIDQRVSKLELNTKHHQESTSNVTSDQYVSRPTPTPIIQEFRSIHERLARLEQNTNANVTESRETIKVTPFLTVITPADVSRHENRFISTIQALQLQLKHVQRENAQFSQRASQTYKVLQQHIQAISNEIVEKQHFELQSFVNTLGSSNIATNKFEQLEQLVNSNIAVTDYEELREIVEILSSDTVTRDKFTQLENRVSHLTQNQQETLHLMEQQCVIVTKDLCAKLESLATRKQQLQTFIDDTMRLSDPTIRRTLETLQDIVKTMQQEMETYEQQIRAQLTSEMEKLRESLADVAIKTMLTRSSVSQVTTVIFKSDITIHHLVSDKRSADILSVSKSGELLIGCRGAFANNQLHIYTELGHMSSIKLQHNEKLKDAAWTFKEDIIYITKSSIVTMSRSGDIICKTNIEHARSLSVSFDNTIYVACKRNGVYQWTDEGKTSYLFSSPDNFDFKQVIKVSTSDDLNTDTFWALEKNYFRIREYTLNKQTSLKKRVTWRDISAPIPLPRPDDVSHSGVMAFDGNLNVFVVLNKKSKTLRVYSVKELNEQIIDLSEYLKPDEHICLVAVDSQRKELYLNLTEPGKVKALTLRAMYTRTMGTTNQAVNSGRPNDVSQSADSGLSSAESDSDNGSPSLSPTAEAKRHDCVSPVNESKLSDDWEHVEDKFTSRGGELFHWASDNSLRIVSGAIPVGETWCIRGQMHTILDQFDEYLSLCKNYNTFFSDNVRQYCSSVFELHIVSASDAQDQPIFLSRSTQFDKPVSITMRYAAMGGSRQDLHVFCVQDNDVIQEITIGDANDKSREAPYFLLDDDYVTIRTKHFSYYFVCKCGEQPIKTNINFINALVYGRIYPERDGEYTHKAHVDFGLQFIPSLTILPEFWQKFVFNKREQQKRQCLSNELKIPADYFDCSTDMRVSIHISTPDWIINTDMCDMDAVFELKDVFQCTQQQIKPLEKYFALTGKQNSVSASIQVTLHRDGTSYCPESLGFSLNTEPQAFEQLDADESAAANGTNVLSNRRDNTAISNKYLSLVARAVSQECIQLLALELDFLSEFKQLRSNNHANSTYRFTYTMLEHWCDKQLHAGIAPDEVVQTLSQKLMIAECLDAAFQLQSFVGSVIESKDLMKLAKLIPPDNYYSLGAFLEIKITELKRIRIDNNSDVLTAIILMLELWCKRALKDGLTLETMVNNLAAALSADGLNSVARKLTGYAENKCLYEED